MSATSPDLQMLPLIPIDDVVVLPGMTFVLSPDTPEMMAVFDGVDEHGNVVLAPRIHGQFTDVGLLAEVTDRAAQMPTGNRAFAMTVLARTRLGPADTSGGILRVEAQLIESTNGDSEQAIEQMRVLRALLEGAAQAAGNERLLLAVTTIQQPAELADFVGMSPDISLEQRKALLEAIDVPARLEIAIGCARAALEELDVRRKIRDDVTEGMERQHREFLLRRQLQSIRKELAEFGGDDTEFDSYRDRIEAAPLPDAARTEALREIARLEAAGQSPEAGMIRSYLDWLLAMPWDAHAEGAVDVSQAAAILDEDHAGLDDVKQRILEYLAVMRLKAERGGNETQPGVILCLVGPPGVGKTSLGASIARALDRPFQRIALGGIRDEADIRGHRRTYIGALPGRIVRALRDAAVMNPVILLDEIDKLATDWRGDPAAALLEVLDPAQNAHFRDHYLDTELDLSQVLFIATANAVDTIPAALYDRLEIISLDGYTDSEKREIAARYLVPRQRAVNGLTDAELTVPTEVISEVIDGYTREAGVRELERQIGTLARKQARRIADHDAASPTLTLDQLHTDLGKRKYENEAALRTATSGVATGLAVTGAGGDVLFIEAAVLELGGEALKLTGQLGDVMKESASIALSYVLSERSEFGIPQLAFLGQGFHVHVPAGAIPKDGPSAGVTMAVALVSLLSGRSVRPEVGMTGEITLRGGVLPVGGIKQKVLAAHRAGLTEVILPRRNERDLDDIPTEVREQLTIHLVETIEEAVAIALVVPRPTLTVVK